MANGRAHAVKGVEVAQKRNASAPMWRRCKVAETPVFRSRSGEGRHSAVCVSCVYGCLLPPSAPSSACPRGTPAVSLQLVIHFTHPSLVLALLDRLPCAAALLPTSTATILRQRSSPSTDWCVFARVCACVLTSPSCPPSPPPPLTLAPLYLLCRHTHTRTRTRHCRPLPSPFSLHHHLGQLRPLSAGVKRGSPVFTPASAAAASSSFALFSSASQPSRAPRLSTLLPPHPSIVPTTPPPIRLRLLAVVHAPHAAVRPRLEGALCAYVSRQPQGRYRSAAFECECVLVAGCVRLSALHFVFLFFCVSSSARETPVERRRRESPGTALDF